ncbi:endonuclease domain-containing protein [Falsiroseomonas tokyonensis]|uniref:Endonuclease domain-containing protein n=1 Tax=Falsiroseomonas tokyonensis TaxID=430521 RepID=A0ABV7BZL0_9PROT|nr:endonuclease domain-containing protein [Falsiroseomonas tokyonensis]MBU8539839.1 endonuclease domain-containing protein [Falsiroseomonas tokyonensis]
MPIPNLHDRARRLRRDATDAELILWRLLRTRQVALKFRRQHPVPPYVADFACVALRLVVELDGGQHGGPRDVARDTAMRAKGWIVLRYWNNEVLENPDGVLADILRVAAEVKPAP